jgi:glycosyl transferase, family 25
MAGSERAFAHPTRDSDQSKSALTISTGLNLHVHFINLDRSKDRLAEFLAVNSHLAEVTRCQAVDVDRIDLRLLTAQGLVKEDILSAYPIGAVCYALWHFKIWNMAIESGKHMTVADDDAIFNLKFDACAAELIGTLPPGWDMIHWGWNFDNHMAFDILPGVTPCVAGLDEGKMRLNTRGFQELSLSPRAYRLRWSSGTPCCTVSPKGAQNLKSKVFPLRPYIFPWPEELPKPSPTAAMKTVGLDITLNSLYRELNAYVCFPPLVITKNERSNSTIQSGGSGTVP